MYNCLRCGQEKPESCFHANKDPRSKKPVRSVCKECHKADERRRYAKNPEPRIALVLKRRDILQRKLFAVLGDECNRCGETDHVVLELDHVYADGYLEGTKRGGSTVYRKALSDPDRFQLLCANCHVRKSKNEVKLRKP